MFYTIYAYKSRIFFFKKRAKCFAYKKKRITFATQFDKIKVCPDGGIGRRAGLKHQWSKIHPGSTPGLGTRKSAKYLNINT